MIQVGKAYKVKVELPSGENIFGRAEVVEKDANRLFIRFHTSKEPFQLLSRGTRVWFVGDTADSSMNGLWATTVTGTKAIAGKTAMELSPLKFVPVSDLRSSPRVHVTCPVKIEFESPTGERQELSYEVRSRNMSKSGLGVEVLCQRLPELEAGSDVYLEIDSKVGKIPLKSRVVHIDPDWLTNRIYVGFEFTEISPEAATTLGQLLSLLGWAPKQPQKADPRVTQSGSGSLSTWLRTSSTDLSLVKLPVKSSDDEPVSRPAPALLESEENNHQHDDGGK